MLPWNLEASGNDDRVRIGSRRIADALAPVVCEALEYRRLLTTFTYNVPAANPPHTAVYIYPKVNGDAGQVEIRLDSPTAAREDPNPFDNTSGLDLIIAPSGVSNFLFFDRVPAALKPFTALPDPGGIKVQADSGSNATLRMETKEINNVDRSYSITTSTTSDTRVRTVDSSLNEGDAHIGTGVTNLVIRTNDLSASNYWPTFPNPGSFVNVTTLADGIHLTVDTGASTYSRVKLGDGTGVLLEQATVLTGGGYSQVITEGTESDDIYALVDFGPRSTLGHNFLDVKKRSTVTLAKGPGTANHIVVVEDVDVSGIGIPKPAILIVADPSTIDDLDVNNYAEAFVLHEADGTTIPSFTVGAVVDPLHSYASIAGESTIGTFTIEGEVDFFATSAPSTVSEFAILATSVPDSTGIVNVKNGADVTALTSSKIGSLNFFGTGKLTLQARRDPPNVACARMLWLANLFMGSNPATPNGQLDLKDNLMILDYSGSSPLSAIQSMLTSGCNSLGWDGNGINSSSAANDTHTALGFAVPSDIGSPSSFEGESIDSSTILVKYTFYGDANLDGTVNLTDFNYIAANFGVTPTRWVKGDFNYSNTVNLTDFNFLASNFGSSGLGYDDGCSIEQYTQEQLEEMWNELNS